MLTLRRCGRERSVFLSGMAVVLTVMSGFAQQTNLVPAADSSAAPLTLTLRDALARARSNEPQYRAALTDYGVARQNAVQARAGLLPSVSYNGQFLYTQGNGTTSGRYRYRTHRANRGVSLFCQGRPCSV